MWRGSTSCASPPRLRPWVVPGPPRASHERATREGPRVRRCPGWWCRPVRAATWSIQDLAQLGREAIGIATAPPGFVAHEPAMAARKDDRLRPKPLGDFMGAAVGHLALRLRAGGHHDPCRRGTQRVEVRLVVGGVDDVLVEQDIGPVAVILRGHAELRGI